MDDYKNDLKHQPKNNANQNQKNDTFANNHNQNVNDDVDRKSNDADTNIVGDKKITNNTEHEDKESDNSKVDSKCNTSDKVDNTDNNAKKYDYPNAIIDDKLFLGNWGHGNNVDIIKNLKLTHIINVCQMKTRNFVKNVEYTAIDIEDTSDANMLQHLDKLCKYIGDALSSKQGNTDENKNKVLVHCLAGVSRSATVVIAYLIKYHGMKTDEALKYVKTRRPRVAPNHGFVKQLQQFEKLQHK